MSLSMGYLTVLSTWRLASPRARVNIKVAAFFFITQPQKSHSIISAISLVTQVCPIQCGRKLHNSRRHVLLGFIYKTQKDANFITFVPCILGIFHLLKGMKTVV